MSAALRSLSQDHLTPNGALPAYRHPQRGSVFVPFPFRLRVSLVSAKTVGGRLGIIAECGEELPALIYVEAFQNRDGATLERATSLKGGMAERSMCFRYEEHGVPREGPGKKVARGSVQNVYCTSYGSNKRHVHCVQMLVEAVKHFSFVERTVPKPAGGRRWTYDCLEVHNKAVSAAPRKTKDDREEQSDRNRTTPKQDDKEMVDKRHGSPDSTPAVRGHPLAAWLPLITITSIGV
ncbi:hypothetical protein F5887DRAFT_530814 [Amanita rubescens]|nr:hypothetical protein F5887DRAFT_53977 [Amanita rubescens]KAF8337715.1 hypothetical protein F5887DRAFT_530814 [Amanita rubescens]